MTAVITFKQTLSKHHKPLFSHHIHHIIIQLWRFRPLLLVTEQLYITALTAWSTTTIMITCTTSFLITIFPPCSCPLFWHHNHYAVFQFWCFNERIHLCLSTFSIYNNSVNKDSESKSFSLLNIPLLWWNHNRYALVQLRCFRRRIMF